MANGSFTQGPNIIHPEKPSAVGSRNSLHRNGRNEYKESSVVIDEEVDKVLSHIQSKLPPEVLEKLHVGGSVKEVLHNYYNQSFQNMFNRYMTTVEDEMGKKYRDMLDKEETKNLNRYTPREVADLLTRVGGQEKFNTGEIEKSIVNIYGHLQGHTQRGMFDLEQLTNSILRQKVDVGAFVRGENTYAVVKCSFSDNYLKPETVNDVRLVVNILDEELISPIYHYQVATETIIKDIVSDHIFQLVDREVEKVNNKLLDEGQDELSGEETIFEKMKGVEQFVDAEDPTPEAKQYAFVAHNLFEAIKGIGAEIDSAEFDPLNFRENIKRIVDQENLRNRGYNTALNALTAILDTSRMGYQHIENFKNHRRVVIQEYEENNQAALPDERYSIYLSYYDDVQLREQRGAYVQQLDEMDYEIHKLWGVVNKLYVLEKRKQGFIDFDDVAEQYLGKKPASTQSGWFGNDQTESIIEEEDDVKLWDEITFIGPEPTEVERMNSSFDLKREKLSKMLTSMRGKLKQLYGFSNPTERIIAENRLSFLESEFTTFNATYNPFHVLPGLLLEVEIATIKRKQTTMSSMSNVLNEFLSGVSRGFSDAAFAGYSRRRSTERSDIDQEFGSAIDGPEAQNGVTGVAELD